MLALLPIVVIDLTLDHVVQGEDVPRVVCLRLHHAFGSHLELSLRVVCPRCVQGAEVQARDSSRVVCTLQSLAPVIHHWSMENGRKGRLCRLKTTFGSSVAVRVVPVVECGSTWLQRLQSVLSLVNVVHFTLVQIAFRRNGVVAFTHLWREEVCC